MRLSTEADNLRQGNKLPETEGEDLEGEVQDQYIYKGPKNNTGIFKNSLILKDLTGYVDEPEHTREIVNETMDAGTQTIIHEEPKIVEDDMKLNFDAKKALGTNTHVVTPRDKRHEGLNFSTKRHSMEIEPEALARDSSYERLD